MGKVLCFGEMLLRFSPSSESVSNNNMPFFIGGAELNVAAALATWGSDVEYCTVLPNNFLSNSILKFLHSKNIGTHTIHFQGDRLGLYYLAQGQDMKNESVVFDRIGSSFSKIQIGDIDWDIALKGVSRVHISAIAASLTQNAADMCKALLIKAKSLHIPVSIDLNYRAQLWKYGKLPTQVIPDLIPYCDIVMGNIWAVEKMLGIPCSIASSVGKSNSELMVAALKSIEALQSSYTNVLKVAFTFRLENAYYAILHEDHKTYESKVHSINDVIDKVGSGDCFMAGLLYGTMQNWESIEVVNYAAAAAVGKLYENGDITHQTVHQIKIKYS